MYLFQVKLHRPTFHRLPFLDIWCQWDSGWYLNIARRWYPAHVNFARYSNYGFFPLYPLLIRILKFVTRDYVISGLIISNLALLCAAYFLYKLVKLDNDEQTALGSVKYLFLFPFAFILSGLFTESLFLFLVILSFYFARREKWHYAGIAGLLASLTRLNGVLLIIPLLYEYVISRKENKQRPFGSFLWLLFIPAAAALFSFYTYCRIGDWLAYLHNKVLAWGFGSQDPFQTLLGGLTGFTDFPVFLMSSVILIMFLLLILFAKKIRIPYFIFGLLLFIIPLCSRDPAVLTGMPRYILAAFPLFMILACLAKNRFLDSSLTFLCILLQGIFMVFWVGGFKVII